MTNEIRIWSLLKEAGLSDAGIAGVMGNLYAESGLEPENLQDTFESRLGMMDYEYTAAVDNGTYQNFVHDGAGYGLAQWTWWSRKQRLLEYAATHRVSIGDLEMQVSFLVQELGQFGLLERLMAVTSVDAASDMMLFEFERPADQSDRTRDIRRGCSRTFYEKYRKEADEVGYTNSPLAVCKIISPNKNVNREHAIDRITIHCTVSQCTAEALGALFADRNRCASSNYGVDKDGRVGLYVEEKDRSWCSSSKANDSRAVTIETASDNFYPYAVTDAAYRGLIDLCVDICKRNGKTKLLWFGDKDKTLAYEPAADEMVMTVHRWFENKSCVPLDTEVLTRDGWVQLRDVEIGDEIACADLNDLHITFEPIYDKIGPQRQDTYTNNGLTATKDHRMVYFTQSNPMLKIEDYKHLLRANQNIYIPLAGHADCDGLPLSAEMIAFYCAVQADGHYMFDKRVDGGKSYYGVEFHFCKERKIERLCEILRAIHLEYSIGRRSDGSTAIRIYNQDDMNIVEDICEKYLCNKCFTWDWLNLSKEQAAWFLAELQKWDGCEAANIYTSTQHENLDVVSAIAALNGVGSNIHCDNIQFRENPYITLSHDSTKRNNHIGPKTDVGCVSVKTGLFLCRQNGKTFIIGNCPGEYLYQRQGQIAEEVTRRLEEDEDMTNDRFRELMREYRAELQDNDSADWSDDARAWAVETGLVKGGEPLPDGNPNYMWQDLLTREQMVVLLHRFAQMMGRA